MPQQTNQPRKDSKPHTASKAHVFIQVSMVVLLLVCAVLPIIKLNTNEDGYSYFDNRPYLSLPETFDAQAIEDYLIDRVGYRKELMGSYAVLHDKLFHVMKHPLYEYGLDDYVFMQLWSVPVDDYYANAYARYVAQMHAFCQARDIPFIYVLSPGKARIYPEKVPSTLAFPDQGDTLLKKYLDKYGVPYLDQADALLKAKLEGQQVYNVKFDAGHWNSYGAYVGSQAIIKALQYLDVPVGAIDLSEYEPHITIQDDLKTGYYPIYEETVDYAFAEGDGAVEHPNWADELVSDKTYHTNAWYTCKRCATQPKLLMFQGSYYNKYGVYLQNQFSETLQIHAYHNIALMPYYVELFNPDVVIFESADYTITEEYYSVEQDLSFALPKTYELYQDFPKVEVAPLDVQVTRGEKLTNFEVKLTPDVFQFPYVDEGLMPVVAFVQVGPDIIASSLTQDHRVLWALTNEHMEHIEQIPQDVPLTLYLINLEQKTQTAIPLV